MSFYLKDIKLLNFKNYAAITAAFNPKFNAFIGNNGMGKTNLLDAIYYLCIAKSYFTSSDRNVLKFGEPHFRLEGKFQNVASDKVDQVVAKVVPGKSKDLEFNGKKYKRQSEHIGKFPIVIIAPADIYTLLESSEARRKFLDRTLIQFDKTYLNALMTYNRLLQQRNALLKRFAEGSPWNEPLLVSLEQKMSDPCALIFKKRKDLLETLIPIFNEVYAKVSGEAEESSLEYKSDLNGEEFAKLILEARDKDRILRRTTVGIHKDDIVFRLNGKGLKTFASQGQLKSFVFSLKLSQYQFIKSCTQKKPILILDDIFDKLDVNRVSALIRLLGTEEFGQIFISDTSEERMESILEKIGLDKYIFNVREGEILNDEKTKPDEKA